MNVSFSIDPIFLPVIHVYTVRRPRCERLVGYGKLVRSTLLLFDAVVLMHAYHCHGPCRLEHGNSSQEYGKPHFTVDDFLVRKPRSEKISSLIVSKLGMRLEFLIKSTQIQFASDDS